MSDVDLEVYRQCHEHLRETDRKRNQLAAYFVTVMGLILANRDKIERAERAPVMWGLALVGVLVVVALIHYRRWHITYVRCVQAAEAYLRTGQPAQAQDASYGERRAEWLNPLASTETALFYVVCVLAFVPMWFGLRETGGLVAWSGPLADLANLLAYLGLALWAQWRILSRRLGARPGELWILKHQVPKVAMAHGHPDDRSRDAP